MISYKLNNGVIVSLDATKPYQSRPIIYSGDEVFIEYVQSILQYQCGAFGLLLINAATPVDLDAAMNSPQMKQKFQPEITEGQELVTKYESIDENEQAT